MKNESSVLSFESLTCIIYDNQYLTFVFMSLVFIYVMPVNIGDLLACSCLEYNLVQQIEYLLQ